MVYPIFVRGFSRSGGTLLVTILDAHPDIAMSYELYPNLLTSQKDEEIDLKQVQEILFRSRNMKAAANKIKNRNLRTFLIRCLRGGLDNQTVANIVQQHIKEGQNFSNLKGRMQFMERCCLAKMQTKGKLRWGLKCSNKFEEYAAVWSDACFLNIIRDGRDVLASQLNTGSFQKSPEQVGKGWSNTHLRFREVAKHPNIRAYEVFYEKLVLQPEQEIRKICEFLNISFDISMLQFYKKDLDIYQANHLSMDRISQPIDQSKIGRWQKELNKEQIKQFYSTAKDAMIQFGYLLEDEC